MHTKEEGNKTRNQEKNQSVETNPDMTKMMGFKSKDFKTSIINLINKLKHIKGKLGRMRRELEI